MVGFGSVGSVVMAGGFSLAFFFVTRISHTGGWPPISDDALREAL